MGCNKLLELTTYMVVFLVIFILKYAVCRQLISTIFCPVLAFQQLASGF